ncbi:MAG: SGNH/GDSL hydrolase family protein [Pseudomonadota bacterium]
MITAAASLRAGGPARLLGLGDSLTAGWMVRRGFFPRACDLLEARVPGLELERVGAGVPGDTARGGLGRLPALLEPAPGLVLVQFGINDCVEGGPRAAFRRDLGRIAAMVAAHGAACVLLTSCPVRDSWLGHAVAPWYQEVRALGAELGLPIADLAQAWSPGEPGSEALWQADGVHPTDAGHARMAEVLAAHLLGEAA